MILPNKYLEIKHTLFGIGLLVVDELSKQKDPIKIDKLWKILKKRKYVKKNNLTFQLFYKSLIFLFVIKKIKFNDAGGIFYENFRT